LQETVYLAYAWLSQLHTLFESRNRLRDKNETASFPVLSFNGSFNFEFSIFDNKEFMSPPKQNFRST